MQLSLLTSLVTERHAPWAPPTGPMDLTGVRRLSFDVERYDPRLVELGPGTFRGAFICGFSIGTDDGRRAYYPIRHEGGGNCDWDVVGWIRRALDAFDGELVGAKLLYDLEAAAHEWGVRFGRVRGFHDVQIAEAVIDEWRLSYALDRLARDYLNETKVEGRLRDVAELHGWRDATQVKGNLWRLRGEDVGEYGEGDADLPLRILERQLVKLEADGQTHVYDLERRLIPVLLAMRLRGVRVAPVDQIMETRGRLVRERDRWAREVKRLLGPRAEFNVSETLGQGLVDRGIDVPRTSPKSGRSKWSVTKEVLEKNAGDAAIRATAAARRVDTLINLTIDSLLAHRTADGRVHCEFNPLKGEDDTGKIRGAISRFSSSHPNLQQIPTRESVVDGYLFEGTGFDVTAELRGLYLPEAGEYWESNDESQVEYRLLVHYAVGAGADEARRRYREDPSTDYHKYAATTMRVDPEDSKKRKRVKNLNFAYAYGARDKKLAVTFNCPLDEATAFRVEFERKMPFVRATYEKAAEWAERRGFVETVLGRRCRFVLWEPRGNFGDRKRPAYPLERAREAYPGERLVLANTYKALNRKLQGSGADIIKKAMVDAHEGGITDVLGAFLVTVHDELGTSTPRTRAGAEASAELRRIMETCVPLRVPLLVKTERGPSWGAVDEDTPLIEAA